VVLIEDAGVAVDHDKDGAVQPVLVDVALDDLRDEGEAGQVRARCRLFGAG
jgi:hypothetical protein